MFWFRGCTVYCIWLNIVYFQTTQNQISLKLDRVHLHKHELREPLNFALLANSFIYFNHMLYDVIWAALANRWLACMPHSSVWIFTPALLRANLHVLPVFGWTNPPTPKNILERLNWKLKIVYSCECGHLPDEDVGWARVSDVCLTWSFKIISKKKMVVVCNLNWSFSSIEIELNWSFSSIEIQVKELSVRQN